MLKVGLTGNIGSGKTTIAQVFELLCIPVFYADNEAKKVMVTDNLLIEGIKQTFGRQAYFNDGSLNRKYISGIVFNDKAELEKLNALVHPAVFRAFESFDQQHKSAPYVIREAAILFESGSYKLCNRAIMIAAPLETRIARVMERDGIGRADVENREARQLPQDEKLKMADDIIINDGTQLVIPQVLALHKLYLSLAHN